MAFRIVGLVRDEKEQIELRYISMVASTGMRWRGNNE